MSKYEKICAEIAKIEEKMSRLSGELKAQKAKKTELENVEIINAVREIVVDGTDLMAFLEELKRGKTIAKKEVKADEDVDE